MGAIKKAFETIGNGIKNIAEGVGKIVKGLVTLDLRSVTAGLNNINKGFADFGRGMINLTPAGLAVNTLLDGAMDKIMKKIQAPMTKLTESVVNNLMEPLTQMQDGLKAIAKGIVKGDIKLALQGLKDVAIGAIETASNFGPGGVAKNVARLAVDAAVDMAKQKAESVVSARVSA